MNADAPEHDEQTMSLVVLVRRLENLAVVGHTTNDAMHFAAAAQTGECRLAVKHWLFDLPGVNNRLRVKDWRQ